MKTNLLIACIVIAAAGLAGAAPSGESELTLLAPGCAVEGENVVVGVVPPPNARGIRVYFRAEGSEIAHYVLARRDGEGELRAVLPRPAALGELVLFAEARLGDGTLARGSETRIEVMNASACAPPALPDESLAAAKSIVLGVPKGAPEIPEGFDCSGIVSRIDDSGVLGPHDACAVVRLAEGGDEETVGGAARDGAGVAPSSEMSGGVIFHHNRPRRTPGTPPPPKPRVDDPRPISPVKP